MFKKMDHNPISRVVKSQIAGITPFNQIFFALLHVHVRKKKRKTRTAALWRTSFESNVTPTIDFRLSHL